LIQVTYELNEGNKERELKPLLSAYGRFKCKELTVLTWEQEEIINEDKVSIKITPLWKWLPWNLTIVLNIFSSIKKI